MGLRRKARESALQMLFQWDLGRAGVDEVAGLFWEMHEEPDELRSFAELLFKGCVERVEEIDRMVQRHTDNWRLDRMTTVDRNLLRMATFELLAGKETPASVVINEAVEIARRFSAQESPQFINGILDSIRKELDSQASS